MDLEKGDRITIIRNGWHYHGVVISAENYGTDDQPNWYIELHDTDTRRYMYWKQAIDGGKVVKDV